MSDLTPTQQRRDRRKRRVDKLEARVRKLEAMIRFVVHSPEADLRQQMLAIDVALQRHAYIRPLPELMRELLYHILVDKQ